MQSVEYQNYLFVHVVHNLIGTSKSGDKFIITLIFSNINVHSQKSTYFPYRSVYYWFDMPTVYKELFTI